MKNFKLIVLLFMAVLSQNLMAQAEVKKPGEVFEMYFGSFVKNDQATLNKLNEYLKPTVEGQDAYQVDFKTVFAETLKNSTEGFLSAFSKSAAKANKKEADNYFIAMMDNFKNGKVTVKDVKIVQNEYVEDQKIAEVTYSVSFKVPSKMPDDPAADPKKINAQELKKYLTESIQNFKNADKEITTELQFSLYQLTEGGKIYYWNGSPDEIVTALTDFYFAGFGS
ncbi:MAG: hypothetical protein LBE92_15545 [Chryseobacterium sp.]|uniref:hypothetical protein n=1 Tax=Chryseobacterium sp. TaxID=1871047 RepID=UPI0028196EAB|nr:hypothetical protein [Chryseobacterium sp.]MDR2237534.1 hypothetical protein [Chryseobacterium sp.]